MNGILCKNPSEVTADDFLFRGLNVASNTSNNIFGFSSIQVLPRVLPGLNTLGISVARIDFAASGGQTPPHIHPRATEVLVLLEGSVYVGFVSFNQSNNSAKLFSKVLYPGDVFVFPQALVHFVYNVGEINAVAINTLSSQNPGNIRVASALFGARPSISVDLLSKAFKLDAKIVEDLQSKF